jgi:predicted aldo/keto reductase-like oxidoreductase
MKYRQLGRTGKRVSALGFGTMRLPTRGSDAEIDEPEAIGMLRYAVDHGVNYVDTAYGYHGGNSEVVVGKALDGGYREKVFLATKSPIWKVDQPGDFDRFLHQQLARLQTDHIDFYLLHCLQKKSWPKMRDLGVLEWAEKVRSSGQIGEFGFSFHDSYEAFTEIVDGHDWSFCQIQYNFAGEDVQAGTRGLKYAAEQGLAVIIMEPLFGGTLASPPQPVWEIWNGSAREHRPADLALRWLWDQPEVSLVLSGMSTLEQVKQNLESACRSGVGWLDEEESEMIRRVRRKYRELSPIPCTKCGYCMPCPRGVNVPINFELYNHATVFKGSSMTLCRNLYNSLPTAERAEACEACGTCEEQCPQQIKIGQLMARVHQEFAPAP